jgi:hypothetical protein
MKEKPKKATGPVTAVGKARSSQNALKTSIFSKGYLDWEDQDLKQKQFEALVEQWNANDPSRQMILRSIEHAFLSQERLMYTERKRIEGIMMSVHIVKMFCERAGILSGNESLNIPSWFFMQEDHHEKIFAEVMKRVEDQAQQVVKFYDDFELSDIHLDCPDLYAFITQNMVTNENFSSILKRLYKKSNDLLNLEHLIVEINDHYCYHLTWARNHERYQTIIDGIRAEQMQEAMDLEKSTRYATNFQNRIMKGFQTLVALTQFEREQHNQSTNGLKEVAPLEKCI